MPKKCIVDVERAAQMYENGMTLQQIANHFGCNAQAISQRFYERGIPTRGSLHYSDWFDIDKAISMYVDQGHTLTYISNSMWVSPGKVKNELLKAGCVLSRKRSERSRKKPTEGESN